MSNYIKKLLDQRAAAWADAQGFQARAESNEDLTAEDRGSWERALDDVDRLTHDIEVAERSAALPSADDPSTPPAAPSVDGDESRDDTYAEAFRSYLVRGMSGLSSEHRDVLAAGYDPELRAQGAGSGSAGGYTVPTGFWAKVTETQKLYAGASVGAEVINTDTGAELQWPTVNDTGNKGYILGENTVTTSEGDVAFGTKSLKGYAFVSGPILVSYQLIQDSGIDIEAYLAARIGERLSRAMEDKFAVGTGSSQPQGFVVGATTGKTTSSATQELTYENLVDLVHSVDAAYRQTGRCAFKMHDTTIGALRKLRDDHAGTGTGLPLWQPSTIAAQPDTFLGYPVIAVNQMDNAFTTGKKNVAFGDFQSAFVVRYINGGQIIRLTERYADYNQIGFIGFQRADSVVQDASAVKLLVQA